MSKTKKSSAGTKKKSSARRPDWRFRAPRSVAELTSRAPSVLRPVIKALIAELRRRVSGRLAVEHHGFLLFNVGALPAVRVVADHDSKDVQAHLQGLCHPAEVKKLPEYARRFARGSAIVVVRASQPEDWLAPDVQKVLDLNLRKVSASGAPIRRAAALTRKR